MNLIKQIFVALLVLSCLSVSPATAEFTKTEVGTTIISSAFRSDTRGISEAYILWKWRDLPDSSSSWKGISIIPGKIAHSVTYSSGKRRVDYSTQFKILSDRDITIRYVAKVAGQLYSSYHTIEVRDGSSSGGNTTSQYACTVTCAGTNIPNFETLTQPIAGQPNSSYIVEWAPNNGIARQCLDVLPTPKKVTKIEINK